MIRFWPEEHSQALYQLAVDGGLSYREIAAELNKKFGTSYTKDAVLGRAWRLKLAKKPEIRKPRSKLEQAALDRARWAKANAARKAKRWAEDPSLFFRSERSAEKKLYRSEFLARGNSKTSAAYRKHLPLMPEMSKSELRAMLSEAIRNTAVQESL